MALSVNLIIALQLTFFVCSAAKAVSKLNNRPIIGVMMQSSTGMPFEALGSNYIAASYIKYLESSGARVAPIWNNLTKIETEKLFNSINGVLFPGGNVDQVKSGYAEVGRTILDFAMKSFDKGDYFPVWGTCLGHEFLSVYVTESKNILTSTDSENITLTLSFRPGYRKSKVFHGISPQLAKFLSEVPSTSNFHDWSVTVTSFNNSQEMKEFYAVTSTSFDRNGIEFVSTMEGKKYPFFSTQWHPEKNSFEWSLQRNLSHVAEAIQATQYMSNFFVNKARLSMHKFKTQNEEEAALIYNYTPLYTGGDSGFEQCYFFSNSSSVSYSQPSSDNVRHDRKAKTVNASTKFWLKLNKLK